MKFTCTLDPSGLFDANNTIAQEQMPFAIAQSLTRSAAKARKRIQDVMPQVFDRPTPATIKGVLYKPAKKTDLTATVFVLDEGNGKSLSPNKWLAPEVDGGPRNDKRLERALKFKGLMPKDAQTAVSRFAPLDVYGNLKGSFVVQLMSVLGALLETGYTANRTPRSKARQKKPLDYFIGRPEKRGRSGVWERIDTAFGSAIRPIVYFIKPPTYHVRLPFDQIVQEVALSYGMEDLRASLIDAIRTAKPKA